MSSASSIKPNRQVVAEASAWFVDFRAGDLDAPARDRFAQWLRRSPDHIQAYLEVAGAWAGLPDENLQGKIDVDALLARTDASENVVAFEEVVTPANVSTPAHRSRRRFALAASLAVVAIASAASVWIYTLRNPSYATQIGEQRSIALPDGSSLDLNARSKVRIHFDEQQRSIELLQGQALFSVAKDSSRPFVVSSGGAQVRALGTRFDVYRKHAGTVVTVLEGEVAVSSPAAMEKSAVIAAGQQTLVTAQAVAAPRRADTAAATAWTQKQLMFEETSLAEVAEEFNRYNLRQLVIADPQLRGVAISGVYSSTDPASLLRFLHDQPAIAVSERGDEIVITRKPAR